MSIHNIDNKAELADGGAVEIKTLEEKNVYDSNILVDKDLMNEAFLAENHEHEMGVWEAAKKYPMACTWAFIFCFTIVSATDDS